MRSSTTIDLDQAYRGNSNAGRKIKNALSKKSEIKTIQAALASFCFSVIQIAFPNHPVLSDTSGIDASAFESIETLFISLNESVDSSASSSSKSDNGSQNLMGDSNFTRDPDFFSDDEFFISSQPPNFQANIKIEPEDDTLTFTPRIVRKNSTSSPNNVDNSKTRNDKNGKGIRKLSNSPFDDIEVGESAI